MEIRKSATKIKSNFKKNRTFDSIINPNHLKDSFLPLPWKIWPYEGKLLLILIGIWSVLGLFILGSASWWVASKEMGGLGLLSKKDKLFGVFLD